jgi:hypothetical protein
MEINVADYLSDEDIKGIVTAEVANVARNWAQENTERVLANAAFSLVFEAVDATLDGRAEDIIREKALEAINRLGKFEVFRPANAWERETSGAFEILKKAVDAYSGVIFQRVRDVIEAYPEEELHRHLEETLPDMIAQMIKAGAANKQS